MTDHFDQRREQENRYFQQRRLARMSGEAAERAAIGRETRQLLADVGLFPAAADGPARHPKARTLLGLAGVAFAAWLEYRNRGEIGDDVPPGHGTGS
jgi:hypothetical protein